MGKAVGRPTIMTPQVLQKLELAFSYGCTDDEACFFADIAPATLYNYQKEYPEFMERKTLLKTRPILLARQTIVNALQTDTRAAQWYLEHRGGAEFSLRNRQIERDCLPTPIMGSLSIRVNTALDDYLKLQDDTSRLSEAGEEKDGLANESW